MNKLRYFLPRLLKGGNAKNNRRQLLLVALIAIVFGGVAGYLGSSLESRWGKDGVVTRPVRQYAPLDNRYWQDQRIRDLQTEIYESQRRSDLYTDQRIRDLGNRQSIFK